MKLYRSYMFRAKDPVIDELRTIVEDYFGARVTFKHLSAIEKEGGPSSTAMAAWFYGKTRKPQSASVEAAGRALGYRRKWVRMNGRGR